MFYKIVVALTRQQKRFIILAVDLLLIALSFALAKSIVMHPVSLLETPVTSALFVLAMMCSGAVATVSQGLHKVKLNAYQMQGVMESAIVAAVLMATGMTLSYLGAVSGGSVQLFIVVGMTFLILSVATRLLMRRVLLRIYANGTQRKPLIIFGAGQTGQQLAMALATDDAVEPVAFIDDDRRLQGLTVAGLRVYPATDLMKVVKRRGVKRIVLAIPSANRNKRAEITRRLSRTGCEVHALPSFADLVANNARNLSDTRPVNVNELLGRDQMEEELPGVSDTYLRRRIMVTGAGGSIGSEICRQLITCRPASLILVDHSELALFEIDRELRSYCKDVEIVPVLGSVCDKSLVEAALADNEVDIVLHAAAYKHVPLVESNGLEGIRVNVFGTKIVAEAARSAGVERFILVSTDKAVRPSSIMGASKRFAELLVQDLATRSQTTRFSMVRFGNVLGSSGSVIPIFQKQISRGGPVTLTHADITRYFMTIPEAVRLVLLAGSFARGGDVFVLDMGKPVPVRQLARKMIESAGYTVKDTSNPTGDIEIKITGLRPGEKLHEELLIGSDMLTTPHPKILRAQETGLSELEMANAIQSLRQALETRGLDLMKQTLEKWIEKDDAKTIKTVNE